MQCVNFEKTREGEGFAKASSGETREGEGFAKASSGEYREAQDLGLRSLPVGDFYLRSHLHQRG